MLLTENDLSFSYAICSPSQHLAGKFAGEMIPPSYSDDLGFRSGDKGTHTSRTLMLEEISTLLAALPATATREEYVRAIVDENVLGKATSSTRRQSAQRLTELYALDGATPIFRTLRKLWDRDREGQPLLALLSGLARDPLLRATQTPVIGLREGQSLDRDSMTSALRLCVRDRLNDEILDKVVRNASASWTQSGHLVGRTFKKRQRVRPTPASVTMALLLGFLQGIRGPGLLRSPWCEALDGSPELVAATASRAALAGMLRFRQAGDVVEASFPDLLTKVEIEKASHGSH